MKKEFIKLHMKWARDIALLSKAERLKVGAILVTANGMISTGYNGTFPGDSNICELSDGSTSPEVYHAEENILNKMLHEGVSPKGATLIMTDSPCGPCSRWILSSGIKHVIYDREYRLTEGIDYLKRHNVIVEQFKLYEDN